MPTSRWVLPLLLAMAVVLRCGTFLPSVINHDESTYLLIGKGLLHGQTYLVDSYDTKPVGIFLIYAALNALGGGSIFVMRLVVALVVGFTAYLLYLLAYRATAQARIGWAAAVGYLFMTGIFKFYGLSPNTEHFFVPLTVAALLLAWGPDRRSWHFALAGLLLGLGFVIKYFVAADALAIGLFLLWRGWHQGRLPRAIFAQCLPLTLAFFIPFAAVAAYYAGIGHWEAFQFYSFEVSGRYPVRKDPLKLTLYTLDFFGRFLPFTALAVVAARERLASDRVWRQFLWLWLLCTTAMTLVSGKTFGHYQIQIMPPLLLLMALWFHPDRRSLPRLRRISPRVAYAGVWGFVVALSAVLLLYYGRRTDHPRQVAAVLEAILQPGERFYTGDYQQVIYHLMGQPSVLPYVHPSLIFDPRNAAALQIDLQAEARLITDDPSVRYVLLRTSHAHNAFTDAIYARFTLRDTLPDDVLLLERNK